MRCVARRAATCRPLHWCTAHAQAMGHLHRRACADYVRCHRPAFVVHLFSIHQLHAPRSPRPDAGRATEFLVPSVHMTVASFAAGPTPPSRSTPGCCSRHCCTRVRAWQCMIALVGATTHFFERVCALGVDIRLFRLACSPREIWIKAHNAWLTQFPALPKWLDNCRSEGTPCHDWKALNYLCLATGTGVLSMLPYARLQGRALDTVLLYCRATAPCRTCTRCCTT